MKFFIALLLISLPLHADNIIEIPMTSDAPDTDQNFSVQSFESFAKLLRSSRLGPHLECELKVEYRQELRKYSEKSEYVDLIEVRFRTEAGWAGGDEFKAQFPRSSKFGRKITANHWSGEGEDFKIRANDYYGHWLRFIHDGKGRIVLFMIGNNLRTYPCIVRD